MSETYSLACYGCREYVWFAQGNDAKVTVYSGESDTMRALAWFLVEHQRPHVLGFGANQRLAEDFSEIHCVGGVVYRRRMGDFELGVRRSLDP